MYMGRVDGMKIVYKLQEIQKVVLQPIGLNSSFS
jgi:hypothetical protein